MPVKIHGKLAPAQILAGGFALTILAGTLLLMLPAAAREGSLPFTAALFTATSAVCVTGLVVVDTGTYFTLFGQLVILSLLQIGGLGFMTMASSIFLVLGRKITLRERLVMQETLNQFSLSGLAELTKIIVVMSFAIEAVGAFLLSLRFVPQFGFWEGIYKGIFHAVSAYCNAGFDIMGNYQSLTAYAGDYWVSGIIMALYILGGIGFVVLLEVYEERRFRKLSLHAKFVLLITLFLLAVATLFILGMEAGNPLTLGALEGGQKVLAAFFTAATPRTAGFNTVPTDMLTMSSKFFIIGLMFIGASPASTGGGIKTTTMGILFWTALSVIRGDEDVTLLKRNIPLKIIKKSLAVVLFSLLLVFAVTLVLTATEGAAFLDVFFESVSAFGTVGLSLGLTPELSPVGRIILSLTMFAGRIGPLTMVLVLTKRMGKSMLKYPDENIMIG